VDAEWPSTRQDPQILVWTSFSRNDSPIAQIKGYGEVDGNAWPRAPAAHLSGRVSELMDSPVKIMGCTTVFHMG